MNTTIVIVTYNAMPRIQRCLKSCGDYPMVVVDNNSTDETVKFVKYNFKTVAVLQQNKNLGFGLGNNVGIKYALKAGADYVFLLNQDAYLYKDTLQNLVKLHKKEPEYGILSPIHLDATENKLDKNFSSYTNHNANPYIFIDALKNNLKDVYEVPFVNAAGWLLSRKCIDKVGYFDPLFFMYGEDDNYCQRASYHKFKIGVAPSIFMIHDRENREEARVTLFSKDYYQKRKIFYLKNLADINRVDFERLFQDYVCNLKIKINFCKRRFKFKKAHNYKKELNMIYNLYPKIINSRKNNINLFLL